MTQPDKSAEGAVDGRDDAFWKALLRADSPRQLLGLLEEGDPLGLVERTAKRLREHAMLLEVDHVHARVLARVAYECALLEERSKPEDIAAWLDASIERSMDELARHDREELDKGLFAHEQWDARYLFLTQVLGVPSESSRASCATFNGLSREYRRAFFAISIDGLSLEAAANREGVTQQVLRDRVRLASKAFLGADVIGHTECRWEEQP